MDEKAGTKDLLRREGRNHRPAGLRRHENPGTA